MDILRVLKPKSRNAEVVGLVSAVCVLVVSYITPVLLELSGGSSISEVIGTSLMVVVFLSYLLAMFAPAIWLGVSRGWKAGVSVIVFEVIWLALIVILSIGFLVDKLDSFTGY